jgi:hypothetical protein
VGVSGHHEQEEMSTGTDAFERLSPPKQREQPAREVAHCSRDACDVVLPT